MMGWSMGRDVASVIHVNGFDIPQDGAYAAALVEGVGIVFAVSKVARAGSLMRVANGARSLDDLSRAASVLDRGELTLAGRALQKRGGRRGSTFPMARGKPSAINQQGQYIVDDILAAPGSTTATRRHARFGNVTEFGRQMVVAYVMVKMESFSGFWSHVYDFRCGNS
ncbi:hypothetical protein ACEK07_04870 [Alcanivoracaceae bacterium MT1]